MSNTTQFTLGQAADYVGRSKATLSKALKTGKLSYVEKTKAGYKIDLAELTRVYGEPSIKPQNERLETGGEQVETEVLKARAEIIEQRLEDAQATIEDLRRRLDKAEAARDEKDRQLTALLTDERDKPKGIFARLFGF